MNWLDIVLGVILIASTVAGLAKGFARTVVGIAATVIGLIAATWFYGTAGDIFRDYVSSKSVSNFLGFLTVFLIVVLAGALLGRLLQVLFKWAGISWLDRILGGCFGFLRGMLVAIVIVMILMAFTTTPPPRSVSESTMAPYVMDASRLMSRLAPRELTEGFQKSYDLLRDAAKSIGKSARTVEPPPKPKSY